MIGVLAFVVAAILLVLAVLTFARLLRLESEIHKLTGSRPAIGGRRPGVSADATDGIHTDARTRAGKRKRTRTGTAKDPAAHYAS